MKKILITLTTMLFGTLLTVASPIELQWIDKTPNFTSGQSWGVPFAKGEIDDSYTFTLTDAQGLPIPTQSWVMARHNDGSVKWMGFYASIAPEQSQGLKLAPFKGANRMRPAPNLLKEDNGNELTLNNGLFDITFSKSGEALVSSIVMDGKTVAANGHLVCRLEDRSEAESNILKYNDFTSKINSVELERDGNVAAVVKVEGVHKAVDGDREWLPFTVRFYVFRDSPAIRMVHTFIFDGDQHTDYIKGIGVEFDIPFREELHNRHVRFAGADNGIWGESALPFTYHRRIMVEGDNRDLHAAQTQGERMINYAEMNDNAKYLLDNWAKWDDFKLVQSTSDGFTIQKRTGAHSSWVGTAGGDRARGMVVAGDVSGGLGVSLKNFWQSFPAELNANDMLEKSGKIIVWMWSPSADAMDLRHYDIVGHSLNSSYEDYVEGYSTPYGIARTSDLTLFPFAEMPSREEISRMADIGQDIVQVMVTPQYLHDKRAFGVWSLPAEDGNDTRQFIEQEIDAMLKFYENAVETQNWYGFWNYGDLMHSYDVSRHTWNYDVGGRAWHNTELAPDLWLWYGFIRSGRADFYRMASSMTRHTSEVDAYHIGPMKGLGSRHNVSHWGCGAKEARIGQAWWKRFFYYLTCDDRVGDLMSATVTADYSIIDFDPLLRAQPRSQYPTQQPTRLRWGPDWIALVGNWYTEWERTGETKWLEKIEAGMTSLSKLPNGLFTGKGPYGYNPDTGVLTYEGERDWYTNSNHLANLMGGFEVMMEVFDGVGHKKFNETYVEYASWYGVPKDDPVRNLPKNKKFKNHYGSWNIQRLTAFAAQQTGDEHLEEVAIRRFLSTILNSDGELVKKVNAKTLDGVEVLVPIQEDGWVSTNDAAQWSLEAIILQEFLGDKFPEIKDLKEYAPAPRAW